ncbi:MAG: hypothetical protein CSA35_09370 [Dethiosulfovibrio peptidovorans]|nr:MAG: hypothetical protein CSA35_09370 [Dethiosulfovibrio peptidovorans]
MRRYVIFLAGMLFSLTLLGVAWADQTPVFQRLGDMEQEVYGEVRPGGLIERLSGLEQSLFGRELPGTVAERQAAVINFVEEGTPSQPSLLFKLAVAEWITEQRSHPSRPVVKRLAGLETLLEGESKGEGPLAMRLERLLGLLVSDPVQWESVTVPAGTVIRVALSQTISPSTVTVGDVVRGALTDSLFVREVLVAPKGTLVEGTASKVKKPRSFGRPGEVIFALERLLPPAPGSLPVSVGEVATKAAQAERAQIAAVGGSLAGAILLGPLGLAGGFLVRGDVKEVPEGTVFHLEVPESVSVLGYSVPDGLRNMIPTGEIVSKDVAPSESEVDNL